MIVSKKHKALILKLREPKRVLDSVPNARVFEHNGAELVAVPHKPQQVRALRTLGIEAPSPILYYYDWPGHYEPFMAQRGAAAFMSTYERAFNLSGMGTGKTLATLWAYDYLRQLKEVHRALVVTPLSTLERTWADEVFLHFPHLATAVLHGTRQKRLKLLDIPADLYLINHDGIKVSGFVEALAQREDIDLVIIDEIAQIARRSATERFRALNTIINRQVPRQAWGLTGTPTPNAPTDAWAQCRLIAPTSVPPYFNRFRNRVMRQTGPFTWEPREDAMATVQEVMQPSIRYSIDECVDLPPCVYITRKVDLTPAQSEAYKSMLARLKAEVDSGQVLAVNEAVKAQKLLQIACGVVYGTTGEELVIGAENRLAVVEEVVREAGTKVIVFVPFVSAVTLVSQYLSDSKISTACIHGGVSKADRDEIFSAFQQTSDPKVLVAQPAAMSHGLTLTAASTIVWFAPITSNEVFEQANARIVRPGQKHSQLIVMLEGTHAEQRYYKRLKARQSLQGVLLDLVQGQRESELLTPAEEGV